MSSFEMDLSRFDAMTDEELKDYLRSDFQSDENSASDPETLLYVSHLLAQRSGETLDTDRAWDSFLRHYCPNPVDGTGQEITGETHNVLNQPSRHKRSWLRAAAIAACLALCLVITSAAVSANKPDWWDKLTKWTVETFGFQSMWGNSQDEDTKITDVPEALHELANHLLQNKATLNVLPTFMPDGAKHSGTVVKEYDEFTKISCIVAFNESRLIIQYRIFNDPNLAQEYQKNDNVPDQYTLNGITFHFFSNLESHQCIWVYENIECSITGIPSREMLIQIIESI